MGYLGINTFLRKTFLCTRRFFVPWEHCLEEFGVSICRVVTKFEITVLGVPKLQKTVPRNVELPATLCRSVAEAYVSGIPKIIIKYYLIPITLI